MAWSGLRRAQEIAKLVLNGLPYAHLTIDGTELDRIDEEARDYASGDNLHRVDGKQHKQEPIDPCVAPVRGFVVLVVQVRSWHIGINSQDNSLEYN